MKFATALLIATSLLHSQHIHLLNMKFATALLIAASCSSQALAQDFLRKDNSRELLRDCKKCTETNCSDYWCCRQNVDSNGDSTTGCKQESFCDGYVVPDIKCDFADVGCCPYPTPPTTTIPTAPVSTYTGPDCVCSPKVFDFVVNDFAGLVIAGNLCINNPLKTEPGIFLENGSSKFGTVTACKVTLDKKTDNLGTQLKSIKISTVSITEYAYGGKTEGPDKKDTKIYTRGTDYNPGSTSSFRSVSEDLTSGQSLQENADADCKKTKLGEYCDDVPIPIGVNVVLAGQATSSFNDEVFDIKIKLNWGYVCPDVPFVNPVDFSVFVLDTAVAADSEWCP